ncbi:MAG: DUF885 family protein, partial [Betaproteobacteria bacterium]
MTLLQSKRAQMLAFALAAIALVLLPLLVQQVGSGWVRIMATALLYVLLALQRLRDTVAQQLMPRAPDAGGLLRYPGGAEVYAALVRQQTTTQKTPQEL